MADRLTRRKFIGLGVGLAGTVALPVLPGIISNAVTEAKNNSGDTQPSQIENILEEYKNIGSREGKVEMGRMLSLAEGMANGDVKFAPREENLLLEFTLKKDFSLSPFAISFEQKLTTENLSYKLYTGDPEFPPAYLSFLNDNDIAFLKQIYGKIQPSYHSENEPSEKRYFPSVIDLKKDELKELIGIFSKLESPGDLRYELNYFPFDLDKKSEFGKLLAADKYFRMNAITVNNTYWVARRLISYPVNSAGNGTGAGEFNDFYLFKDRISGGRALLGKISENYQLKIWLDKFYIEVQKNITANIDIYKLFKSLSNQLRNSKPLNPFVLET